MNTERLDSQAKTFQGFEPLSGNYIYCPNQFFEVCLRHCSRGAVRLVAHVLRKTLGYLDENGNLPKDSIGDAIIDAVSATLRSTGAVLPENLPADRVDP